MQNIFNIFSSPSQTNNDRSPPPPSYSKRRDSYVGHNNRNRDLESQRHLPSNDGSHTHINKDLTLEEADINVKADYTTPQNFDTMHMIDEPREDTRFLDSPSDEESFFSDDDDDMSKGSWISKDVIRDGVIGGSDGLTVPFALTAGLSAFGDTRIVINGGMAELIAGMISMGIGGWLAAKSEEDYYNHILQKTRTLVNRYPKTHAAAAVRSIFAPYNVPLTVTDPLIHHLQAGPSEDYVQFLMCTKHQLPPPSPYQAAKTAITIALGYFIGGMVSLSSYFFVGEKEVLKGLIISIGVMTIALFLFGWGKVAALSGWKKTSYSKGVWEGIKMVMVGGLAAGCAWGFTRLFDSFGDGAGGNAVGGKF